MTENQRKALTYMEASGANFFMAALAKPGRTTRIVPVVQEEDPDINF
jgi:hypothetical protein